MRICAICSDEAADPDAVAPPTKAAVGRARARSTRTTLPNRVSGAADTGPGGWDADPSLPPGSAGPPTGPRDTPGPAAVSTASTCGGVSTSATSTNASFSMSVTPVAAAPSVSARRRRPAAVS